MGKGKKGGGKKGGRGREMEWEAEGEAECTSEGDEPCPRMSAKDKQRQKMASKRALKVQITELKKTRAKIGKARDKRMDRRVVTNQLKELKATTSVPEMQGGKDDTEVKGVDSMQQ